MTFPFEVVGGTSDGKCLADKRSGESIDGLLIEIRFWLLYFVIIFFISWRRNSFNCKFFEFCVLYKYTALTKAISTIWKKNFLYHLIVFLCEFDLFVQHLSRCIYKNEYNRKEEKKQREHWEENMNTPIYIYTRIGKIPIKNVR